MAMQIFDFPQGSPDWFAARAGIPTASMFATVMAKGEGKIQKTYMLKLVCPHDDEYKLRMTQKMLDEYGAPICPCHREEMIEA